MCGSELCVALDASCSEYTKQKTYIHPLNHVSNPCELRSFTCWTRCGCAHTSLHVIRVLTDFEILPSRILAATRNNRSTTQRPNATDDTLVCMLRQSYQTRTALIKPPSCAREWAIYTGHTCAVMYGCQPARTAVYCPPTPACIRESAQYRVYAVPHREHGVHLHQHFYMPSRVQRIMLNVGGVRCGATLRNTSICNVCMHARWDVARCGSMGATAVYQMGTRSIGAAIITSWRRATHHIALCTL